MIYDFGNYQKSELLRYDVCICGAGAAGITLARFLASSGKRVALLEGGGRKYSLQSQDIYKGQSIGLDYYLDLWRLRYLGGTTNHWAGRCRPFEKEDFRERTVNGLPGWPISFNEFDSYLSRAKMILGLPAEDTFKIKPGSVIESNIFEPEKFHSGNPVRFGEKYFDYLASSQDVDVFLDANVVNVSLADNFKTVDKVDIKSFNGNQGELWASNFILSMGAIENARILLCSNRQIKTGIGNQTDMVGRCFMEHLNVDLGEFIAEPTAWGDNKSMAFFTRPENAAENNISMSAISLGIVGKLKAYGRTAELKKLFNEISCSLGISKQLQFMYEHRCIGEGRITTLCEQLPNKESRVILDKETDKLGLRRVILDWQISAGDEKSIRYIATQMAVEFAKNNLGRIKLPPYILDRESEIPVHGHAHHMGTTRMASDPEDGVVDSNSQVFETTNLYIAGSSVFPTVGGGNPTMPIVQLALRLGDFLKAK